MGSDLIRAAQRPWHDCAKYVCNSFDSDCQSDCCFGSPCKCHLATHEIDDDSPIVIEREPPQTLGRPETLAKMSTYFFIVGTGSGGPFDFVTELSFSGGGLGGLQIAQGGSLEGVLG